MAKPANLANHCPECERLGLISDVVNEGTMSTLLGWSSTNKHNHDPNRHADLYRCNNGHRFEYCYYIECPVAGCPYGKEPPELAVFEGKQGIPA